MDKSGYIGVPVVVKVVVVVEQVVVGYLGWEWAMLKNEDELLRGWEGALMVLQGRLWQTEELLERWA